MTEVAYAQIVNRTTVDGGTDRLDLAVQTDEGAVVLRGIPDRGFARARGLVVGILIGGEGKREFVPIEAPTGVVSRRAIVESVVDAGGGRWRYSLRRAIGPHNPAEWFVDTDSAPFDAFQPIEGFTGGGQTASGVAVANLQGFAPVPLGVGARVIADLIDGFWYVRATQALDGSCGGGT